MRRSQFISPICEILPCIETQPRRAVLLPPLPPVLRHVGNERGERLVEPQVVPPHHGHQVAEPLMDHLVQQRVLHPQLSRLHLHFALLYLGLVECHQPHIFHRTHVVIGHEHIVLLLKRKWVVELIYEEFHSLGCFLKPVFVFDKFDQ